MALLPVEISNMLKRVQDSRATAYELSALGESLIRTHSKLNPQSQTYELLGAALPIVHAAFQSATDAYQADVEDLEKYMSRIK